MIGQEIDKPTPEIRAAKQRWIENRDVIEGERAVKRKRAIYLPMAANMSDAEYQNYLKRVPFFPGASRTHTGLMGLVFRQEPTLQAPAGLEGILSTITRAGHNVEDLAEEVVSETLITGYTGLLVDMGRTPDGVVTVAQAEAANHRPFVNLYPAETILEVTTAVIRNRQIIQRVRLLEDDGDTVRELFLDDNGLYAVTVHHRVQETWVADDPIYPLKNGAPLTEIPFVLVTTKPRSTCPQKGPLDDVCLINLHLYREQADAKNSRYYSSAPVFHIIGAEAREQLIITPGTVLQFPESTKENPVTVGFAEFSGAGQATLENAVTTYKDEMAAVGSRILAAEKVAAEAAETLAIRRASEHATLAALSRLCSRKMEEVLNMVSDWVGQGAVTFELSTDFLPSSLKADERKALLAEWLAGAYSHQTYLEALKDGGALPETLDVDVEIEKTKEEHLTVDQPILGIGTTSIVATPKQPEQGA